MSTQQTMITRWPCHVRDRHADKITIYGWSTRRVLNNSGRSERRPGRCIASA
jgi:hypothetical protein